MPVARRSIVLTPLGRRPTGSALVSVKAVTAVATMASVPKYMHSDEGNSDQYPNPVR